MQPESRAVANGAQKWETQKTLVGFVAFLPEATSCLHVFSQPGIREPQQRVLENKLVAKFQQVAAFCQIRERRGHFLEMDRSLVSQVTVALPMEHE